MMIKVWCKNVLDCQNYFLRPNVHFRSCFIPMRFISRDHIRLPVYLESTFIRHWSFYSLCLGLASQCPASHKWAYLDGKYCCKFDVENVDSKVGPGCDGSKISRSSSCCKNHAHVKCHDSNGCANYVQGRGED